jgi:hypothetical protein
LCILSIITRNAKNKKTGPTKISKYNRPKLKWHEFIPCDVTLLQYHNRIFDNDKDTLTKMLVLIFKTIENFEYAQ